MDELSLKKNFEEANSLLATGKFSEAAAKYDEIIQSGFTSAEMESNFGRSLVESGRIAPGLVHLEKSQKLDRFSSSIRQDLNYARRRVDSQLGTVMEHPAEWGYQIRSFIRPQECFYIGAVLFAFLILSTTLKNKSKLIFKFLVTTGCLFLCLGIAGRYSESLAILISDSELKNAPLSSAEVIQKLPAGTRLRVIRNSGSFSEIERSGVFRGWISSTEIHSL
jgi:hypothetical protein